MFPAMLLGHMTNRVKLNVTSPLIVVVLHSGDASSASECVSLQDSRNQRARHTTNRQDAGEESIPRGHREEPTARPEVSGSSVLFVKKMILGAQRQLDSFGTHCPIHV